MGRNIKSSCLRRMIIIPETEHSSFSDAASGGNIASELRLGDKDYVVGTFIAIGALTEYLCSGW